MSTVDLKDKKMCQLHPNENFLGEADFIDKDGKFTEYILEIDRVTLEDLQLPGRSRRESKVVVGFKKAKKRLVLNKTNAKAIKSHYGKPVANWYGKPVTVFFDQTVRFGAEVTGGVRVRRKK